MRLVLTMLANDLCRADLVHAYFKAKHAAYASPMTVKAWMDSATTDVVIVDVRNPSPLLRSGIPGAVRMVQPRHFGSARPA